MSDNDVNESYRISDQLWEQIKPLLPPELPKPKGGRPRINDRKVMEAILCIFRAGWKWKSLPSSLGSPSTVRHRFKEWQKSGVFQRMWLAGLLTYDEMRALVWYGKKRELHHEE
jgi:putative transposase